MKAISRYHNYLLTIGSDWSERNPLAGLYRAAMPWLIAMLGLCIIGVVVDPKNLTQLAIMMIGWVPSLLGLFYAMMTFGVGAVKASRARRANKATVR